VGRTSNRDRQQASDPAEPELVTPPELLPVLEALRRREPIFHRPEFGSTRADFERMAATDFWEIGASGHRYSRAHVLDVRDSAADTKFRRHRRAILWPVAALLLSTAVPDGQSLCKEQRKWLQPTLTVL